MLGPAEDSIRDIQVLDVGGRGGGAVCAVFEVIDVIDDIIDVLSLLVDGPEPLLLPMAEPVLPMLEDARPMLEDVLPMPAPPASAADAD